MYLILNRFAIYLVQGGEKMATIDFKNAVGRIYFNTGMTEDGKIIRKSKTYRNIVEGVAADNLYKGLEELAKLSSYPWIGAEKVETADVNN
jgi:hypothetical protein